MMRSFNFFRRVWEKAIIGPRKYSQGDDYDAASYWRDRFTRYGNSFYAVGDDCLTEEENKRQYQADKKRLVALLNDLKLNLVEAKILDIGCGNGFYTEVLRELGVKNYIGIDITDKLFPALGNKFPNFTFLKMDITEAIPQGKFDLIIMIGVIEHILIEEKLRHALAGIKKVLAPQGIFILSGLRDNSKKRFFYVRDWSTVEFKKHFPGYFFSNLIPFWSGYLLAVTKHKFRLG